MATYTQQWNSVSKFLHWTMVLVLLAMAIIGLTMGDIQDPHQKIETYALHKSLGLTALGLVILRVIWRLFSGAPAKISSIPRWQHGIASLTHALLYVMMFAIPLSGWAMNSAKGYPLQYFKLFNLPAIAGKSDTHLYHNLHEWGFWFLVVLVIAHVGAAFFHHLFQGDNTLRRMLPFAKAKSE